VLHVRLRKGSANTQRGILRFTDELIARIARAGATGIKLLRTGPSRANRLAHPRRPPPSPPTAATQPRSPRGRRRLTPERVIGERNERLSCAKADGEP